MRGTMLQTFGGDTVSMMKIVCAFKTETRRGQKGDLPSWTREHNEVNLT